MKPKWIEELNSVLFHNIDLEGKEGTPRPMKASLQKCLENFIQQTLDTKLQSLIDELEKEMVKNIGKPPYSSVDREYLQFNQGLQTAINKAKGMK